MTILPIWNAETPATNSRRISGRPDTGKARDYFSRAFFASHPAIYWQVQALVPQQHPVSQQPDEQPQVVSFFMVASYGA